MFLRRSIGFLLGDGSWSSWRICILVILFILECFVIWKKVKMLIEWIRCDWVRKVCVEMYIEIVIEVR